MSFDSATSTRSRRTASSSTSGIVEADPDTLYIDCSAVGIHQPPTDAAVFEPGVINLLLTRQIQPVFSAVLNAFIESRFDDDDEKNAMCRVVPYPSVPLDWLVMWQTHSGERGPVGATA